MLKFILIAPVPRIIQSSNIEPVTSDSFLGGLHHSYYRKAA